MAITAKFVADFTSFTSAIDKAEVELKSFESGANQVGKALNRMVDNFSGRRVIQEATLMATAVQKLGGTSGLTSRELARMGPVAQDALTKLNALLKKSKEDVDRLNASIADLNKRGITTEAQRTQLSKWTKELKEAEAALVQI